MESICVFTFSVFDQKAMCVSLRSNGHIACISNPVLFTSMFKTSLYLAIMRFRFCWRTRSSGTAKLQVLVSHLWLLWSIFMTSRPSPGMQDNITELKVNVTVPFLPSSLLNHCLVGAMLRLHITAASDQRNGMQKISMHDTKKPEQQRLGGSVSAL